MVGTTNQQTSDIDWTSSLISVTGTASLSGTVMPVIYLDGDTLTESGFENGTSLDFTILTATGGYTGTFDDISSISESLYAFLDLSLDYSSSSSVVLNVSRNDTTLEDVANTKNQKSVATALDYSDHDNDVYAAILTLSESGARNAYNQVDGEHAASTQGAISQNATLVGATIEGRVNQAFDASGEILPSMQIATHGAAAEIAIYYTTWMRAYGSVGSVDTTANTASLDTSAADVMVGADAAMGETCFGVFAGYQHGEYNADSVGSSSSDDAY